MPLIRGLARTAAIAGTASAVSGRVQRRQSQRWAEKDAQQAPPEPQYAPVAAAPPAPVADPVQQLKDLADLKEQGILTPEEFAVEKAKVLNR
jgi:hypothetical protein